LVFFFDTSVLGSEVVAWARLRGRADEGWIELRRASALGDDLSHDRDATRAARLASEGAYPEMHGVFVLDESRLDTAVLASDEEAALFERLFAAVFPGTDKSSTARTASNKRRDIMHIHTTGKYSADGFITRDNALLRKAPVVREEFNIRVFSPEEALALVEHLRRRYAVAARATAGRP
jgi:hypothetical protein